MVRNCLKRRFREILRLAPWREGTAGDLAVIAHRQAAQARFTDLEQELTLGLRHAGLLVGGE